MADGFVPPAPVRANAKRGLELREEHGRGGTAIGVARARDLSNGAALSLDTIKRMTSYFARHEVDKKGEGWGVDSAGYIAWLLWGGDAGWSWAKRIVREQESKEKATMNDLTTAYFEIIKADKRDDGTLMVYGKATDDSLDIDQQICDPVWLDRAMPEWFKTGGNIREQHSSIAAGVAKEYEKKADGHYIHALVVDPISVKKVDTGVLKGFSIGIKSPRVVRDTKAANGRIIDGQIVEVSLVDRPANPNCQLVLAKSAEGEAGMWKTEELIEKAEGEDFLTVNTGRAEGYEPADPELYSRVKAEAKKKFKVYPSAYANAWLAREYKKRGGTYKKVKKNAKGKGVVIPLEDYLTREELMTSLETVQIPKAILSDLLKFDTQEFIAARNALANLVINEANDMKEGSDEIASLNNLLASIMHLYTYYESAEHKGEVSPEDQALLEPYEEEEELKMAEDKETVKELKPLKDETEKEYKARCKEAGMDDETIKALCDKYMGEEKSSHKSSHKELKPLKSETENEYKARCKEAGMEDDAIKGMCGKYFGANTEKSAEGKCLECGCHSPADSHGRDDVSTAVIVSSEQSPKSAEPTEVVSELKDQELPEGEEAAPAEEAPAIEEEKVSEGENLAEEIEAIVEKAIKSATESLKTEIAQLATANKAAVTKAVSLESELAVAKSLAVAGGPKRTIKPVDHSTNDLLVKAATYKAKADASTDPDLTKGYSLLAKKYFAEADALTKSN